MPQVNESAETLSLKLIALIDSANDLVTLEDKYRKKALPQIASTENTLSQKDISKISECYKAKKMELEPSYFLQLIHFSKNLAQLEENYREIILPQISNRKNTFTGNEIMSIQSAYDSKKAELQSKNSSTFFTRKKKAKKERQSLPSESKQLLSINNDNTDIKTERCPCSMM